MAKSFGPTHRASRLTSGASRSVVLSLVVACLSLLVASCTPPPAPGDKYRVPVDFGEGLLTAMKDLTGPPTGANVEGCVPSAEHPRPVILLHGFMGNMADNMNGLSPFLANQGYCVFALNYGEEPGSIFAGFADIRRSSLDEFGPFVDQVLAATGAKQVDVVGHSEGSVMPRWWMRYGPSTHADGTPKVATFVGVAPASYGAELGGYADDLRSIPFFAAYMENFANNGCGACEQILAGSSFLHELNTPEARPGENFSGPTQPGVRYLMLATQWDNIVVSYKAGFINDPAVKNMTLQDVCSVDRADHLSIVFDPTAYDIVTNFLSPDHPVEQRCVATEPVFAPLFQGS